VSCEEVIRGLKNRLRWGDIGKQAKTSICLAKTLTAEVKAQIEYATTESALQTGIDNLVKPGVVRLHFISSASTDNARLKIPGAFGTCDFIFCFGAKVIFDRASTYNGERLDRHLLSRSPSVRQPRCVGGAECCFATEDNPALGDAGIPMQNLDAAGVAKESSSSSSKGAPKSTLPGKCFAGFAGIVTGAGAISALLVSQFEFGLTGAYVTCTNGSFALHAAGRVIQASAEANIGILGCVGLGAATVVYFIPWKTFGVWLVNGWRKLADFVKVVGLACKDKLYDFLCNVLLAGYGFLTKDEELVRNAIGPKLAMLLQLFRATLSKPEDVESKVREFLEHYLQDTSEHVKKAAGLLISVLLRNMRRFFGGMLHINS